MSDSYTSHLLSVSVNVDKLGKSVLAISRIYGQWEKNNDLCTIFIIIELFCEHCFIAEYLAKL